MMNFPPPTRAEPQPRPECERLKEEQLSEDLIALVNEQAAQIDRLTYPHWSVSESWVVTGKVGRDDKGYDMYQLDRPGEPQPLIVPSNRLVFAQRLLESLHP